MDVGMHTNVISGEAGDPHWGDVPRQETQLRPRYG